MYRSSTTAPLPKMRPVKSGISGWPGLDPGALGEALAQ